MHRMPKPGIKSCDLIQKLYNMPNPLIAEQLKRKPRNLKTMCNGGQNKTIV